MVSVIKETKIEDSKPVYLELETINKMFKGYNHRQDGPYGKRNLDRKRTNHSERTADVKLEKARERNTTKTVQGQLEFVP